MVTAKGPLEGRHSGTSHALKRQITSSKATTLAVDCAVRVNGDAIAVKVKRHLPRGNLEGRHSGTSHAPKSQQGNRPASRLCRRSAAAPTAITTI